MKLVKQLGFSAFVLATIAACVNTHQMNSKAEQGYMQMKQQNAQAIDKTSTTAKRVQTIFNRMKPHAEQANTTGVPFNWEITVFRSKELNAWAMAGGKMGFYTGLVERLNMTDDEIATVMGHEMAHALQEHSKSAYNVEMTTGILGAVADAAVSVAIGADTGGLVSTGTDLIVNKPFSRSQETEADEIGLMLMARAGYNPSAAPNVWVKMSKAAGNSGISIFSTHPSNEERQANLERLLPEAMKVYKTSKN
ncbi:M48 family metallopeptidase [Actinobacillus equuli subsp. equuli]|uniref:M48 family metallopeptidase n=1 Tax=Actinobacillus equuli subsp. equuli TaxID=202947 RepID=A0A9X4G3E6_ACTEU|nr:M48 family metallopeptidase [Actinobacillus equuli]MDE8034532.1 M48 family metallopeptidase [Actinobacillus equuli subsp. equuli]MDG4947581.1 M48 family metallopeptidase [Actinobacillus equuli subsp. haemolyticus]